MWLSLYSQQSASTVHLWEIKARQQRWRPRKTQRREEKGEIWASLMIRGNKTNSRPSAAKYSQQDGYTHIIVCVRLHTYECLYEWLVLTLLIFLTEDKGSSGSWNVMGCHIRMSLGRWRGVRGAWESLMGGEKVLSDALRPITECLLEEIRAEQPEADCRWSGVARAGETRTQGSLRGSWRNNRKEIAETECVVPQGYFRLHETLRRHQCLKFVFTARAIAPKTNARLRQPNCCANQS